MQYKDVPKELVKFIPEFKKSKKYYGENGKEEMDLPYVFLGFFGQYFVELIDNLKTSTQKEKDMDIIKRGFEFTNYLFESKNSEIINLAGVEIIENIFESEAATKLAYKYLNSKGIKSLNDMFT